jgi:hypothetical protein
VLVGSIFLLACVADGPRGGGGAATTGVGGGGAAVSQTGGAAGEGVGGATTTGDPTCSRCDDPQALATPAQPAVVEASGLAASRLHPGVFYVHNDSGDTARFFAFDESGADQGTFTLAGVTAIDWEDMATGPCADGRSPCLYLADVGDNAEQRSELLLYRVPEPAALGPGEQQLVAETFRFRYASGPQDAEALFVDPRDGRVYVLTKTIRAADLYALPPMLDPRSVMEVSSIAKVSLGDLLPTITAADMAADAHGILVRTYSSVWLFQVEPGESVAAAVAATACPVPVAPGESQGEALAWLADSSGYVTISEGMRQTLSRVSCPRR